MPGGWQPRQGLRNSLQIEHNHQRKFLRPFGAEWIELTGPRASLRSARGYIPLPRWGMESSDPVAPRYLRSLCLEEAVTRNRRVTEAPTSSWCVHILRLQCRIHRIANCSQGINKKNRASFMSNDARCIVHLFSSSILPSAADYGRRRTVKLITDTPAGRAGSPRRRRRRSCRPPSR